MVHICEQFLNFCVGLASGFVTVTLTKTEFNPVFLMCSQAKEKSDERKKKEKEKKEAKQAA